MVDDLLENGIIELLALKRLEEVERTTNPKYCRYHRVISHPLEKCIMLKERITRLGRDGRIILDLDDSIEPIISLLKWNTLFHHDSKAVLDFMSKGRLT